MNLAMTLLVKNEIDVIEAHVRYHRPKVDFMVIMDNMSTDGTYEALERLQGELDGITLLTMASSVYDQAHWVSRMVRHCAHLGADWVVNSDADEFWLGDIKLVVNEFWKYGANIIHPEGTTFWPTEMDDLSIKCPIKGMLWCDPPSVPFGSKKPVIFVQGFSHVEQGNHFVRFFPFVKDHLQKSASLMIRHYPFRREEQFVKKHRGIWSETKLHQMGEGWRSLNRIFVEGGEDALRKYYREQVVLTKERAEQRGLINDYTLAKEIP